MLVQKNNLIICFYHKEGIYWRRMWNMRKEKKPNWLIWILSTFFVTIFHYAYALMHFFFESYLYVVDRRRFKKNLEKMNYQILSEHVKKIKYSKPVLAS